MILIALPVFNEEKVLKKNTMRILDFCKNNLKDKFQIIISDNNSNDNTKIISERLIQKCSQIKYIKTPNQGKGFGVINAWQGFKGDIYVYMDIDLATDIKSLPELINTIESNFDIACGSRYLNESDVTRTIFRKSFSFGLRLILKILFKLKVKDAPCGFKAVNKNVIHKILPKIKNKTWFFDTEMLILAQSINLKIKEIPVQWCEVKNTERKSKVSVFKVAIDYLKSIYSLYARTRR